MVILKLNYSQNSKSISKSNKSLKVEKCFELRKEYQELPALGLQPHLSEKYNEYMGKLGNTYSNRNLN